MKIPDYPHIAALLVKPNEELLHLCHDYYYKAFLLVMLTPSGP
jgi:hypothetical protein